MSIETVEETLISKFYRCLCGSLRSYGKKPPAPCRACMKCGTIAGESPVHCTPAQPHKYKTFNVLIDQGAGTMTMCVWCSKPSE